MYESGFVGLLEILKATGRGEVTAALLSNDSARLDTTKTWNRTRKWIYRLFKMKAVCCMYSRKLYIVARDIQLPDGISTVRVGVGDKHDKNRYVGITKDDRNMP